MIVKDTNVSFDICSKHLEVLLFLHEDVHCEWEAILARYDLRGDLIAASNNMPAPRPGLIHFFSIELLKNSILSWVMAIHRVHVLW